MTKAYKKQKTCPKEFECSFMHCSYPKPKPGTIGKAGTHCCVEYASSYSITSRVTNLPIEIVLSICSFVMASDAKDDMNWRIYVRSICPGFIFPKKVNEVLDILHLPMFEATIGFKLCDITSFVGCRCIHYRRKHLDVIQKLVKMPDFKSWWYDLTIFCK